MYNCRHDFEKKCVSIYTCEKHKDFSVTVVWKKRNRYLSLGLLPTDYTKPSSVWFDRGTISTKKLKLQFHEELCGV